MREEGQWEAILSEPLEFRVYLRSGHIECKKHITLEIATIINVNRHSKKQQDPQLFTLIMTLLQESSQDQSPYLCREPKSDLLLVFRSYRQNPYNYIQTPRFEDNLLYDGREWTYTATII